MTANPSENKKTPPASGGIKSKLTDAQKAMLASKSGGWRTGRLAEHRQGAQAHLRQRQAG